MNLAFITTSRADFGIYLPLIRAVEAERWNYKVFAGGMHVSEKYGNSYKLIEQEYGVPVHEKIDSLGTDDTPHGIASSIGATTRAFADVWRNHTDVKLVFALGDRFEMFAAALSCVPFNIPVAHLHGGETSLGAMDDKFRHALTCISEYHFVSAEEHATRVTAIIGSNKNVFNVGALGLDGIRRANIYTKKEFQDRYDINVDDPFVLVTFHPETVDLRNKFFVGQLIDALRQIPYKILCTLPNADTEGSVIRSSLLNFSVEDPQKIKCFENLGQRGYYSAMYYCHMLIGNTSSGIIEAASYGRPVVNVGNRQKGRLASANVVHAGNNTQEILDAISSAEKNLVGKTFVNIYGDGHASEKIIAALKKII